MAKMSKESKGIIKAADMHNLGEPMGEMSMPSRGKRKEKYYPSIRITGKTLPEVKNIDFNQDVTFHAHGKIVSKNQRNDEAPTREASIKKGLNPRKPPREFWNKAEKAIEKSVGGNKKRAEKITGALWYKKMKSGSKAKYNKMRLKRERRGGKK